jgi:hypothetical protein
MSYWKPSRADLHGLPCLQHTQTKELTAHGLKGCLYEFAPNQLAAILYLDGGDEKLVTGIKPKDAKRWAKRLAVPQAAADQLHLIQGAGQ